MNLSHEVLVGKVVYHTVAHVRADLFLGVYAVHAVLAVGSCAFAAWDYCFDITPQVDAAFKNFDVDRPRTQYSYGTPCTATFTDRWFAAKAQVLATNDTGPMDVINGTATTDRSEYVSNFLDRQGIPRRDPSDPSNPGAPRRGRLMVLFLSYKW